MRRGVTFPEVIVCILLLSIAVLGLISVQIFALKSTVKNEDRHVASVLAFSIMSDLERALREDFEDDTLGVDPPLPVPGHDEYTHRIEVSPPLAPPNEGLRRVQVQIFWSDDGGDHQYEVWSLIYNVD